MVVKKKVDENKVSKKTSSKVSIDKRLKKNPWILSTMVLGLIILVLAFSLLPSSSSKENAANSVLELAQQQLGDSVTLKSVEEFGDNFYVVTLSYQGQESDIYVTKDGSELAAGVTPISTILSSEKEAEGKPQVSPVSVPKSDKPKAELFIMSHCPYGTQAVKGILPIIGLLGDKIDFDLRFVYYAMHPTQGEVEEQLNQYCIQEEQGDKLLPYLECFLTDGDGEACLDKVGIDKKMLSSCYEKADLEFEVTDNLEDKSLWLNGRFPLFNVDKDLNDLYQIRGSPTLVINGEQVSAGRSPSAYLSAICSSFTEGNVPEECSTQVSTETLSPGFGWTTQSGGTASAQCS
jgi:hypothetical protein